jgi:AcrR family transcriptional regulator
MKQARRYRNQGFHDAAPRKETLISEHSSPLVAENKSGQSLGDKGHRTRQRIIEATRALIEGSGGSVPTARAVSRAVKLAAPTFYLYFEDVGEAVLAVVQQMQDELNPVIDLLALDWPAGQAFDRAQGFVTAYYDYWTAHAALLRVRNRMADEGDDRFVALRARSVDRLTEALAGKLTLPVLPARFSAQREDLAAALIIGLERSATVYALGLYPYAGRDRSALIDALALLIANSMASSGLTK